MIHNLQLKWKRAWVEIANLLGNTFDVGVQAVLQVCIKPATRHVCSIYISTKEEKPAKPSKGGKAGICCPLPTASLPSPPFCNWKPSFLSSISSRAPYFLVTAVMVSCPSKMCAPLSTVLWVCPRSAFSNPTFIWNSSYQWSFLASLRSLPHAFSFLFFHWKQRTWALRMPEPQCGRSLGLWSSTWSKAVHSPRHLA